ncbi:MAG: patatin-like phospholipase family protein [Solirubrobacterales bacterium]|nr:patatin-like phospholipase family protein [Solirubrobacterales bacterium]
MTILSIDGGGIRGIIPALVLADLEARTGRRTAELFDLVAGTSTGGILAAAVAIPGADGRPRHAAADLVALYLEEGPAIFSRSLGHRIDSAWGVLEEKYDDDALTAALRRYLGETRASQALTRVLITAYELQTRAPYFVKSWRAAEDPSRDLMLWQAARATAAAPTYFEPALVATPGGGPDLSLVDGGVFATNPSLCAFAEAARIAPGEPVRIVSLGTGKLTRPIRHADAAGWGLAQWVRPLIDVIFDGSADTVDYQLDHLLGAERYHRFQVVLDRAGGASDALDDASPGNLQALQDEARRLIATRAADLDHVAELLLEDAG